MSLISARIAGSVARRLPNAAVQVIISSIMDLVCVKL